MREYSNIVQAVNQTTSQSVDFLFNSIAHKYHSPNLSFLKY